MRNSTPSRVQHVPSYFLSCSIFGVRNRHVLGYGKVLPVSLGSITDHTVRFRIKLMCHAHYITRLQEAEPKETGAESILQTSSYTWIQCN
jgi:hypothetical protein